MRASVKAIEHFESATALVGGVTLHYWLGGDPNGPPILLWHGFLGTSYSWHKVMPLWSKLDTEFWCLICVAMAIQTSLQEPKAMTVARSRRSFAY